MIIEVPVFTDKFPVNYREIVGNFIRRMLSDGGRSGKGNGKYGRFCFNVKLPFKYEVTEGEEGDRFFVWHEPDSPVVLQISFNELKTGYRFMKGLGLKSSFEFYGIAMKIGGLTVHRHRLIKERKGEFKTISAICLKNTGRGDSVDLEKQLNTIHGAVLRKLGFGGLRSPLRLVENGLEEKKAGQWSYFRGNFVIEGDPRDLNIIYRLGFGFRTELGYGFCIHYANGKGSEDTGESLSLVEDVGYRGDSEKYEGMYRFFSRTGYSSLDGGLGKKF